MNLRKWFQFVGRRPGFAPPISGAPRTVVFEPAIRQSATCVYVDPLAPDALTRIRGFGPAVIAGRLPVVIQLARKLSQPAAKGVCATHAVVIFTGQGEACLTECERDAIWRAFRVPVFEQVITSGGHLVAWECEAHEGLHMSGGAQSAAERIVVGTCACGSMATRVIGAPVAPALSGDLQAATLLLPRRVESRPRPLAT